MNHYFEAITNTSGDSLIGYYARVIDPATQNVVPIYSDNNGTPISVVSGISNMAVTDDYGNISLYVEPGTYNLDIYAPNATSFIFRIPNVGMASAQGEKGDPGNPGDPGGNVMSVGNFPTVSAMAIPTGTDVLYTSGATRGFLVEDPALTDADVTARPLAVTKTANGRFFKRDSTKGISVREMGATQDDGTTPQQSFFSAAAREAPARITTTPAFAAMPQAPSAEVWVPEGTYHLTADVDTGGKAITWRCDSGARFTDGSQSHLLGKAVRRDRASSGYPFGSLDNAAGTSVSVGNGSFDQSPLIGGITNANQVSIPPTFDITASYADVTGVVLAGQSVATFTATTAVLTTPANTIRLKRGMILQTTHSPYYRGVLESWSGNGATLTVSGWYPAGSTTAGTPANDGSQVLVNVIHKMWGLNTNVFMTSPGYTFQGTVHEMGIINQKVTPANAEDNAGRIWGADVVNLGTIKYSIGFIARGPGYEGFRATGTDVGFSSSPFTELGYAAPTIGFQHKGNGTSFQQLNTAGGRVFAVGSTAGATSLLLGDYNTPGPTTFDFRSSGGGSTTWDARIICTGGGGEGGGGLQILAAEVFSSHLKTPDLVVVSNPPTAANSPGVAGTFQWDGGSLYLCIATNTWKRVVLAAF